MKRQNYVKTLVALCATLFLISTSATVLAAPTLTAYTDKDVYIPGEYIIISAQLTDGGAPLKNKQVCYEICSPLTCYPGICGYTDDFGWIYFSYELTPIFPDEVGTWEIKVECEEYLLTVYLYVEVVPIRLTADTDVVPAQTGGTVNLELDGGTAYAGRGYGIFGGLSGTSPGTNLPKMGYTLPINWDFFTDLVMSLWGPPIFNNFLGSLDANGKATATLWLPPLPDYIGMKMYYAGTVYNPFDGVTNPIDVTLI